MNTELWNEILKFDFDSPMSEYGFSIRLANENYWTKNFTRKALREYKKFMYLAATSDLMVSPSPIIDIVWHQHLIFTQSYKDFCDILGKQIQHVPSTHNSEDAEKFKLAKERTKKLYVNAFGEQPSDIWHYADMYQSLHLDKANIKIRTFALIGVLASAVLIFPAYYLMKPFYIQIDNPDFMTVYITGCLLTLICLEIYNRQYLSGTIHRIAANSFLFHLQPMEVVYLKTQQLSNVVNGTVNQLIENKKIKVNADHSLEKSNDSKPGTVEEYQVLSVLHQSRAIHYPALLNLLITKPVFSVIANCMAAFRKYFIKSKVFGKLFYINFGVLSILFILGFVRYYTGITRDKPVVLIGMTLVVLSIIIMIFLYRLSNLVCTHTVPALYKEKILPTLQDAHHWEWQYFLLGSAVLTTSFMPIVNYTEKHNVGSSGGSCGSSCGSSCSSCGGCGGD